MASNTYVALSTQTVTGSPVTSITFSSIPQGYTDLVLVCAIKNTSTTARNVYLQFNGDTGNNYSKTLIEGNGSTASSARDTNAPAIYSAAITVANTSEPAMSIINVMNYANNSTYKTTLSRFAGASLVTNAVVGMWRNTSAITSLTLTIDTANNIATGSTFSLYGIAAASVGAKATGGTIYQDASYFYHVFSGNGTFTPSQSLSADILVVSGGGSGSSGQSGTYYGFGGGAGQIQYFASQSLTATGYTCTVGSGGASIGNSTVDVNGNPGTYSQFGALTAGTPGSGANYNSPGGSSGNGFTGGAGNPTACGGGAGAGANGQAAPNSTTPGAGGNGLSTYSSWGTVTGIGQNISGTYWLAGGGGGVYVSTVANGGNGGGGGGGTSITQAQRNGLANTGSGGSGGGNTAGNSGQGGSGVIIVRYAK